MKISIYTLYICSFFTAILLFASCGNEAATTEGTEAESSLPKAPAEPTRTANYNELAQLFCDCVQPSILLNKEMSKLQEAGKRDDFVAKSEEAAEKFKTAISCAREQKKKFTTAVLSKEETTKALLNVCPDIPEKLAETLARVVK